MAYVEIKDFKNGLDTRRPAVVGDPGTLVECVNAHITRGGDVESRKEFVEYFTLESGSFGFHSGNDKGYVFGSAAAPTNLPGDIIYQRLQHPSSSAMTALLSADNFKGKVYAVAEFEDGSIYHYYNTSRVTDWDTLAATIAGNDTVATYLGDKIDAISAVLASVSTLDIYITAAVPGTAFTISVGTTGTGSLTLTTVQANLAATAEVRAGASFTITGGFAEANNKITSILAGATELLSSAVPWVLSHTATAAACAIAINAGTETHGYSATSAGAVVTIHAPVGEGATANLRVLTPTAGGLVTVGSVNNFSGGVTAIAAKPQISKVAVGGTYAGTNTYTVTINGTNYKITGLSSGYGRFAKTHNSKMHSIVRGLLVFSSVNDATAWTSGTGYGQIDMSAQDQGSQRLTALSTYQNRLAVAARRTTQIWAMDPDASLNALQQILNGTGTRSPNTMMPYGNSDAIYLADTGFRSLRARDSSNAAFVDDIGTRIDTDVIDFMKTLTDTEIQTGMGITDPTDGRIWEALKDRIYVFSYFPGSKVSAWSYYELDFSVEGMVVAGNRIYVRSGDVIYVYGGSDGETYPEAGACEVVVRLPYIDANRIAGGKAIQGVDIICSGQWAVNLLVDPNDEDLMTETIRVDKTTVLLERIPINADTTHFAPLLTSDAGGRLTLSSVVVHFEDTETT